MTTSVAETSQSHLSPLTRSSGSLRKSAHEEDLLFPPPPAPVTPPSRYSLNLYARVHSLFCCLKSSSKEGKQKLELGEEKASINDEIEIIDCDSEIEDDFPDSCGAALGSFAAAIGSTSKIAAGCAWSSTKMIANAGLTAGDYAWRGTKKTTGAVASFFDNRIVSGSLVFVSATGLVTSAIVSYQPGIYASSATFGYALQSCLGPKLFGRHKHKAPTDSSNEANGSDASRSLINDQEMQPQAPDSLREGEVETVIIDKANEETALVPKAPVPKESRFVRVMDYAVNGISKVHTKAQGAWKFFIDNYSYELHSAVGFMSGFAPNTLPAALDTATGLAGIYVRSKICHVEEYLETSKETEETLNLSYENPKSIPEKIKEFIRNNRSSIIFTTISGATYLATSLIQVDPTYSAIVATINGLSLIIFTRPFGRVISKFFDKQLKFIKRNERTGLVAKTIVATAIFCQFESSIVTAGYIMYQFGLPLTGLSLVGLAHGAKDFRTEIESNSNETAKKENSEKTIIIKCENISNTKEYQTKVNLLIKKINYRISLEILHTTGFAGLGIWQAFVPGGGYYGTIIMGTLLINYFARKAGRYAENNATGNSALIGKKIVHITNQYQFDFISFINFFKLQGYIFPALILDGITWGTFREQISLELDGNFSYDQNSLLLSQLAKKY